MPTDQEILKAIKHATKFISRRWPRLSAGVDVEQVVMIRAIRCLKEFNPEKKCSFKTFLTACSIESFFKEFRREHARRIRETRAALIDHNYERDHTIPVFIDRVIDTWEEPIRTIASLFITKEWSAEAIALKLDMWPSRVRRIIEKAIKRIALADINRRLGLPVELAPNYIDLYDRARNREACNDASSP